MAQQSHFWAYTLKKPDLKETHAPQCSSQLFFFNVQVTTSLAWLYSYLVSKKSCLGVFFSQITILS